MDAVQLASHGSDKSRTKALRRRAEERFERALGPFLDRIARLAVWVDDINGPRGGVDMRCRVGAKLDSAGAALLTRTVARTAERAINRAARRPRVVLIDRLKR